MKKQFFFLALLTLFLTPPSWGKTKEQFFGEIYSLYKKGDYTEAIKQLQKIEKKRDYQATAHYMKGLCFNKLQEFDKSENEFKRAIHFGAKAKDVHYERGQALFAAQNLDLARKSFAHSVESNYQVDSSLYYMGYIGQIMEQFNTSMKYYRKVDPNNTDVYQAAQFQIGEITLTQAEKHPRPKEIAKKYVLPQLEKAYQVASNSALSFEIENKIQEVKDKYDLDENKMRNGKKLPKKRLSLTFKQEIVYDSNVVSEADETTQKAENIDSIITKTSANGSYFWPLFRRIVVTPKFRATLDHHTTNRKETNIIKNDADSLQPKLEVKLEHKINNKPASFIISDEYNYSQKRTPPYNGGILSGKSFYSRTNTISLAEKFNLFKAGDTTITIKRKKYKGTTKESESNTSTLSALQTIMIPEKKLLIALFNLDITNTPHNKTNSQDSLLMRVDYIDLDCFWGLQCNPALSLTITDTKKQRASRGIEKTINPSFALTKSITKKIEVLGKYSYTKNISKNKQANAYTKHAVTTHFQIKY